MKWKLPQYSGKDYLVLSYSVAPFTFSFNSLLLGKLYFTDFLVFITATPLAAIIFSAGFTVCSAVGVRLRKPFKDEEGIGLRMLVMILVFLLLTLGFLFVLFKLFERIPFFHYQFNNTDFAWSFIGTGNYAIFITFVLEGIARYTIWKNRMKENEQLSNASRQSRLQGLKSQVNPHFLFNSLNSLSSLIQEDEDKAEKFLDEMSKVYRYRLRNEDDELVRLRTELQFVESYYYLLKARYGDGLQITMEATPAQLDKCLPPLTLQTIIENAFTQNVLSKEQPLHIHIGAKGDRLIVRNNVQPKLTNKDRDLESDIDNLVTRYFFLHQTHIDIKDNDRERIIYLPLFACKKEEPV